MKKAFTMIELIFVIVILGILAAVAIPKLSATRTDAKIAALAMQIGTGCEEIATYAVTKGNVLSELKEMSNAIAKMISSKAATGSGKQIVVNMEGVPCINIGVTTSPTNDDLNVSYVDTTDSRCLALQRKINQIEYNIPLRGTSVVE